MKNLARWFAVLSFSMSSIFVGCDDDDDGNNGGGDAGEAANAGMAGTTSGGGQAPGGGSEEGGAPTDAGGTATAGSGAAAGATDDGGLAGAGGEDGAGGAAGLALSDAQILLVLDTLNAGEVEMAYVALPHLELPDVIGFAEMMIEHHGAGRDAVISTGKSLELQPAPSDVQVELKRKAEALVAALNASQDPSLDPQYVASQVMAHAEALELLQGLLTAADAAELQTLINSLEATVQAHYDEAVALQAEP